MPYLQFDVDFAVDEADAEQFTRAVADLYAEQMGADTDYTAVSVRTVETLFLGRATDDRTAVLQADVREGRPPARRREFALAVVEAVHEWFDVPRSNQKVVFTEHAGDQMMGHDRVGDDWSGPE